MTVREILDVAGVGAMLALVIRWMLHLDVEWHWTVCIGAVSLLLQPWLTLHFAPLVATQAVPNVVVGAVVAIALLGVAQLISDH